MNIRQIFGEILFKDKASNPIDKVNRKMDDSKAKAFGLQNALKAIGGAVFLKNTVDIVGNMVDLAASFEQTKISFEVMLGSAEKANAMVAQLDEFSNVTPFTPEQVNENAKMLLNFGIAADSILPSLQALGDVSGGNAEKFSRLSLAFGQVSSQGRLMGQDLLQMINAGFNPLQEISAMTGKSMAQLKDEMSKGLISFDMVNAAFIRATSEGGKFFGMMQKQSETWNGLKSTLEGLRNAALRSIGEIIMKALKPLLKALIPIIKSFVEWSKTQKGMAVLKVVLVGLAGVIGTLMVGAVLSLASAFVPLLISMLPIVGAALAIGAALALIFLIAEDIFTYFQGGDSYFGDLMKALNITREDFDKFANSLKQIFVVIRDSIKEAIGWLNAGIDKVGDFINKYEPLRRFVFNTPEIVKPVRELTPEEKAILEERKAARKAAGIGAVPGRASGGNVDIGKSYLVGEKGAELFTPSTSGYITPNDELSKMSFQSPSKQNTFSIETLVGEINITVQNAKEGADKIKETILDALNELARNVFPNETGVSV